MILRSRKGQRWWINSDTGHVLELSDKAPPPAPKPKPNPSKRTDNRTRELFDG